jgi:F-type H+-transporting ATPase subunit a
MQATHTTQRRVPVKRWIVLLLILAGVYLAFLGPAWMRPLSPGILLAPEPLGFSLSGLPITNTLLATLVADLALILIVVFSVQPFIRSGKLVPQGFYNFFELIIEFLWNASQSTAGRWARRMFPWVATIFLLVLASNLTRLVPGFESIGFLHEAHGSLQGYEPVPLFGNVYALDASHPVEHVEAEGAEGGATEGHALCHACTVTPFLRGSATDLNFTFALAAISVIMIQVFGVWSLGAGYFTKFFNTRTMFTVPMFGVIDFGVGLLELVSEIARVLSFGFRLFGNIFAGGLLLSILGALTAVLVPTGLYLLELFVGLIQAYVFAMLTLVFMAQSTTSHHGDEHGEGH